MRTNIDLNEELLEEFKSLTNATTKREAVNNALKMAINSCKKQKLLKLEGKLIWDGDLSEMRSQDKWND